MVIKAYVYNRAMMDAVLKYMKSQCTNYGYEIRTDDGIDVDNLDHPDHLDHLEYPALVSMDFCGTWKEDEYSSGGYAIIRSVERCDSGVEQLNDNEAVLMIIDINGFIPTLRTMFIDVLTPYLIDEHSTVGIRETRNELGERVYILTDTHLFDHQ